MNLDPIEGPEGDAFYEQVSTRPDQNVNPEGEVVDGQLLNGKKPVAELPEPKPTQEELDLQDAEEKKYRSFAKRRIRDGKFDDLDKYEFKYLPIQMQRDLIREFVGHAVIVSLKEAIAE
jgi:hypothetical protein